MRLINLTPHDVTLRAADGSGGDASKAREKLGWVPRITFKELVHEMVDADLNDYEVSGSKNR